MADHSLTPTYPLSGSGLIVIKKFSYLALTVDAELLKAVNSELQSILGDGAGELIANRNLRDGPGEFHMTVIEPREFRALRKTLKASGGRLDVPQGYVGFEILGIGTAENNRSQGWFAVCRSEAIAGWRSTLELPPKDLHITLAFGPEGDVHDEPKGIDSLIAKSSL